MRLLCVCAAAAAAGLARAAEPAADDIDSIGLPIIFMVVLLCGVAVTLPQLRAAPSHCGSGVTLALVGASAAVFVLSLFILVSPGWAYAAVSATLAHVLVLVVATGSLSALVRPLLLVAVVWFAVLIGVPAPLSEGVVAAVSRGSTAAFPQLASVAGSSWQVFVLVAAVLVIGLTAVQITALLGSTFHIRVA